MWGIASYYTLKSSHLQGSPHFARRHAKAAQGGAVVRPWSVGATATQFLKTAFRKDWQRGDKQSHEKTTYVEFTAVNMVACKSINNRQSSKVL